MPLVGKDGGSTSGLESINVADGSAGLYGPWMMAKTAVRPSAGGRSQHRNDSSRLSGSRFEVLGEDNGEASGSQPDALMKTGVLGASRESLTRLYAEKGKAKMGVDGDWTVMPGRRKRRAAKTSKKVQKVSGDEPSGIKTSGGEGLHVVERSSSSPASETGFLADLRTAGRALSSQNAVVIPMESELDSSKHLAVQVLDSPELNPEPASEFDLDPGDSEMVVASPRLDPTHHEGEPFQMTEGDIEVHRGMEAGLVGEFSHFGFISGSRF
ncbi:nuclear prelamin A recognition factor [Striga asiatica]|uniref:Nuclear prelamin A recognition factor n=1 Tax=Striga asiatica TaxID=4170 RepID=A0A5A7P2B6_STRAF|nr:nuclear prelamin A recognition factor [Striga asiatica]